MLNQPKPLLGDVTAITMGSADLDTSLAFYQRLGFRELYRFDFPYPFMEITDGALLITLRKKEEPFLSLTYYVKNMPKVVEHLDREGVAFKQRPRDFDMIRHYAFTSPEGLDITLIDHMDGFYQPEAPTMLHMNPEDHRNPAAYVNPKSGMFGELSVPAKDLKASMQYWEQLGFKCTYQSASPFPWAIMTDGMAVIGLYQSDEFSRPAITYFAADMGEKIERLKAEGLSDYREHRHPHNITLSTPEQQHFNLFRL